MKRYAYIGLFCLSLALFIFSVYKLLNVYMNYKAGNDFYKNISHYKPVNFEEPDTTSNETKQQASQGFAELKQINSDIIGWLTLDDIPIDYPFAQSADNDYYLRRDLYGEYLYAGTIFMDYRCAPDMSDFWNILYGHHLKNSSMFGSLKKFGDKSYFDEHKTGTLILENQTLKLEIFSYIETNSSDSYIYGLNDGSKNEKQAILDYVRQKSEFYRDIDAGIEDDYLILSTCGYDFDQQRIVLISKIQR